MITSSPLSATSRTSGNALGPGHEFPVRPDHRRSLFHHVIPQLELGEGDFGLAPHGNQDFQPDRAVRPGPGGPDLAAHGPRRSRSIEEIADHPGPEDELGESRRIVRLLDAGQGFVQPGADAPEHGMILGVHRRPLAFLPQLPYRRGPAGDHESPARVRCLGRDVIGEIGLARPGQELHDVFGADDPGRQMGVMPVYDVPEQARLGLVGGRRRRHAQEERQDVGRLSRPVARRLRIVEFLVESRFDPAREIVVEPGVGGFPEDPGRIGEDLRIVIIIEGRDEGRRASFDGHPVAVVAEADDPVFGDALQKFDVALQAGVVFLEDPRVPVILVHVPAEEGISRSPGRVGRPGPPDVRNGVGDPALLVLDVADVAHEVGVERRHVEVHHGLFGRSLGVRHPALPFGALVAVGRDAVEIGLLPPDDVPVNGVEDGVRAGEAADGLDVRMDDAAMERIDFGRSRVARKFHVTVAVIGEPGLPGLHPVALQDIGVHRPGGVQVFLVDHAVRIKQLGEPHADVRPGRAGNAQFGPAAEGLAHVENVDVRGGVRHLEGEDGIHDLDRGHHLGREHSRGALNHVCGGPAFVIEAGGVPAGGLEPGVVGLSVEMAFLDDRAVRGLPGSVARNLEARAVLELDVELEKQGPSVEPPLAQHDAQGVGAFAEHARNVVRHVEDALLEGRPSRIEDVRPDLAAVDPELGMSDARDMDQGLFGCGSKGEFAAQDALVADPGSLPVRPGEKPRRERGSGAPGALEAVLVPPADFPEVGLSAHERLSRIYDLD